MRAAIFDPYLDTLGGGERYCLAVASALVSAGWNVDVQWVDSLISEKLEKRFGIDLKNINFVPDVKRGDGYELMFWLSDGSIPTLHARTNVLHFQVPFVNVNGRSLINKMKLFRVKHVVCNSLFTKGFIDKEYGVQSSVIYPPVAVEKIKPKRKENIILYVGRFSKLKQAKKQDILVKAFRRFVNLGNRNWKLVLAGGADIGEDGFVEELIKASYGYSVEILKSPDFKTIVDLYGSSKIFWSASGYGVDENKHPDMVEHFGIVAVEAMAARLVPVLYNAGGHKEVVKDGENGFLWNSIGDLVRITKRLTGDAKLVKLISEKAKLDAEAYSYERFSQEFLKLIG